MITRTKIICTMGPSVSSSEKIDSLIDAGMNVARLNFSHGSHEEHGAIIEKLKLARDKKGVPLSIMLDTKGPEIRLGNLKKEPTTLKTGSHVWFVEDDILGDENEISITPKHVIKFLKKGMVLLIDDGYVITRVVDFSDRGVKVEIEHGGNIHSRRNVNIPEADIELPYMTDQDVKDILFGCRNGIDWIAASFVRSAEQILEIKKLLQKSGHPDVLVLAKIESTHGVKNIDSIIEVSDGIMVARGDLGVAMPLKCVPRLQKMIIRKSYVAAKPCIIATQMLESMIRNPRPTRAEVSDVANAIYDSTSAVMLSGETSMGNHPIEVVKVMKSIIKETEEDFDYYNFFRYNAQHTFEDISFSVTQASITTAYCTKAKAIFSLTSSGTTARLLSRLRPKMPIVAMTNNPMVYHQLALCWGVIPVLSSEVTDLETAKAKLSEFSLEHKLVEKGDLVVITAGATYRTNCVTNMMIVDSI